MDFVFSIKKKDIIIFIIRMLPVGFSNCSVRQDGSFCSNWKNGHAVCAGEFS